MNIPRDRDTLFTSD